MLNFEHISFFYAYLLVPVILIVYWLMRRWRKAAIARFGDFNIVSQLMPEASRSKQVIKAVLFVLALAFLIMGIINPQIGTKPIQAEQKGIDLMIALDVSNSMKAEDLLPNRLQRAKQAIAKLTERLHGDRLGIIVFAGNAYVQLPITTDYDAAKLFLNNIDTDIVPTQGTAIGAAIDLAVESFGKADLTRKAIIVITDGENHEDNALEAVEKAKAKGIVVHTIGMGSPTGGPIPVYQRGINVGFKKDSEGNTIVTKLDEAMLVGIAREGGGIYVRATNSEAGLNTIFNELEKMQKTKYSAKVFTDYEDRFQYFVFFALLFLVADILLSERKSKWFEKLDLFGERKT